MAQGFKVADAYIEVHTDDDTKKGRQQIERDTSRWANLLGLRLGNILGGGLASGIFKALAGVLRGLFAIAKWMAIAAAIGAVIQAVVILIGALTQLAGLAPLILPGLLALVSVFGALKIAFSGFGEALKAGWADDAEAFAEAMKKLHPEMQNTVRAIIRLKPQLESLKKSVQGAFFAGLANDIQVLAAVYLPLLQRHLVGVASIFNELVHSITRLFMTKDFIADWATTLEHVRGVLQNVTQAIAPVIDGFRHIGTVAAPILERLTSGFADGAQAFAARMAELRANGGLEDFINRGLNAASELIKILVALGSALMPIFRILSTPEALAGLTAITQQFAALMNSAQGMAFIKSLFEILNAILKSLGPGVIAILGAIGQSLLILAPAFTALGNAISTGLVLLAPILEEAAGFIRDIIIGLTPILPILADAIGSIVSIIGPALIQLAPILVQLFEALGLAVGPIAEILADLVVTLAPSLVVIFEALAKALIALIPAAIPVAGAIGAILEALAPLIPPLAQLVGMLLTALGTELAAIVKLLTPIIVLFAQFAGVILEKLMPAFMEAIITAGPRLALIFDAFATNLAPLIPMFLELALVIAEKFLFYLPQMTALFETLVPVIQQTAYLLGVYMVDFLNELMPLLPDLIDMVFQLMLAFIEIYPSLLPMLPLFLELAVMIAALLNKTGLLQAVVILLEIAIAMLIVAVKVVVGIIQGWVFLSQKLMDMYRALAKVLSDFWNVAKAIFSQIGAYVKNAVGSIGNTLYNAGQSVVQGLWNGIKSMGSWFVSNIKSFISNVIPGPVAKFLGIGSPSKLMAKMGKWIPAGLAVGMDAAAGLVTSAATRLAMAAMPVLQTATPGVPTVGGYGAGGSDRNERRDTWLLVDLGDGVKHAVKAVLVDDPALVASSTDEGRRQRSFASSPRAKT